MSDKEFPWFTGKGDDGSTGLIGEGRVPKHHMQPEAFGTVDELSASIGLARALCDRDDVKKTLLRVQRECYAMMSELAATVEVQAQFRTISQEFVDRLSEDVREYGTRVKIPREFVVSGDTAAGGALDVARTVARRAERCVSMLAEHNLISNSAILAYLNRLSSLLFVLARYCDLEGGGESPSLARDDS